jgi:hypothetical protein
MVNDAIPFFEDGDEITCTATVAVLGKHFVKISGNRQADGTYSIAPAGDNDRALGVAMWDCAVNKRVTVKTIESGNIMPVVAAGVLAANALVASDGTGQARVAVATEHSLGMVMDGAAAAADAQILLTRQTA